MREALAELKAMRGKIAPHAYKTIRGQILSGVRSLRLGGRTMKKKSMSLEDALEKVQNLRTMFKMVDKNDSRIPALDIAVEVMSEKLEDGKHGRWKGAGMGDYYCSLCQEVVSKRDLPYCPYCGAKMIEGSES